MRARAGGGLLAVAVISSLRPEPLAVLFSVSILLAVAMSLLGWRVAASTASLAVAGAASGFMGTITSAGAPPLPS